MKLKAFFDLVRFEHAIIYALSIFFSAFVLQAEINFNFIFILLVPIFCQIASFSLNDYLDIKTDTINKKMDRPLVNKTIIKKQVKIIIFVFYFLSIIFSFFLLKNAFLIAIFVILLSILYNFKLKDLPLIGNLYIAFSMAIPFIYSSYAFEIIPNRFLIITSIIAFLVGLSREIVKTVQDFKGDMLKRNSKTLPFYIGKKNSLIVSSFLYFLVNLFCLFFIFNSFSYVFSFIFFIISFILFSYLMIGNLFYTQKFLIMSRKISLISLVLGFVALFFFVLKL